MAEMPYCKHHFVPTKLQTWENQINVLHLPNVDIELKKLARAVHALLISHSGSLPLITLCYCYEAEIGKVPIAGNLLPSTEEFLEDSGEVNPVFESGKHNGVNLEHLITCIPDVQIVTSPSSYFHKNITWLYKKKSGYVFYRYNPALQSQLALFEQEVIHLLKSHPQCIISLRNFISAYYQYFKKQINLIDFGFSNLSELFEIIPDTVQILGKDDSQQVTLTHQIQVERFTFEALRILLWHRCKEMLVCDYAKAYEQIIKKPFNITNYGVCNISDLLDDVPKNLIVTSYSDSNKMMSIPENNGSENKNKTHFENEVMELMRSSSKYWMTINNFLLFYYHHFKRPLHAFQYGFSRLHMLLKATPLLIVKVKRNETFVKFVQNPQHKMLCERLIEVLNVHPNDNFDVSQLCSAYYNLHGHDLVPTDYGFSNVNDILENFYGTFKVIFRSGKKYVCLLHPNTIHQISLNIRRLLMEDKKGRMLKEDICRLYQMRFGPNIDPTHYFADIRDVLRDKEFLQLTPLQYLGRNLILLLQENNQEVRLRDIKELYGNRFGVEISPIDFNCPSISVLLKYLRDYFIIKKCENKIRKCVYFKEGIAEYQLPLQEYRLWPQV